MIPRTRYTTLCVEREHDWSKDDVMAALTPALAAVDFRPNSHPESWRTLTLSEGDSTPYATWCGNQYGRQIDHGHIVVWVDGVQMTMERVPEDVPS